MDRFESCTFAPDVINDEIIIGSWVRNLNDNTIFQVSEIVRMIVSQGAQSYNTSHGAIYYVYDDKGKSEVSFHVKLLNLEDPESLRLLNPL